MYATVCSEQIADTWIDEREGESQRQRQTGTEKRQREIHSTALKSLVSVRLG